MMAYIYWDLGPYSHQIWHHSQKGPRRYGQVQAELGNALDQAVVANEEAVVKVGPLD